MNIINPTIGTYNFKTVIEQGYYVDKTSFAKKVFNFGDSGAVILFARPRRFGKSLMLSMLNYFFNEKLGDCSYLFKNLEISKSDVFSYHNQFPVINVDFKDCIGENAKKTLEKTFMEIRKIYLSFVDELNEAPLSILEREIVDRLLNNQAQQEDYEQSIKILCKAIYLNGNKKPFLFIDEYDAQLNSAYQNDEVDIIKNFFKNFFSVTLKGNDYLRIGIITGVLPFASESLSTGFNNGRLDNGVYRVIPEEYFAFSEDDIDKIIKDYDSSVDKNKLKEWYGGYLYNGKEYYNPWSVINFFANGEKFMFYWHRTGSAKIIEDLIDAHPTLLEDSEKLFINKSIAVEANFSFSYHDIKNDINSAYEFLYSAGYLALKEENSGPEINLVIPNYEIKQLFKKEILNKLIRVPKYIDELEELKKAFLTNDQTQICNFFAALLQSISYLNYDNWRIYQTIVTVISSLIFNEFFVNEEMNVGEGRCDIYIEPKLGSVYTPIIIEVKSVNYRTSENRMDDKAQSALDQIRDKKYYSRFASQGYKCVHLYGLVFAKTRVKVNYEFVKLENK